jgi:uncharacterized coiled-coil protein SlyX
MSDRSALTPAPADLDRDRARLHDLEARLAEREAALERFKTELRDLQSWYLEKMGALHAQMNELDAAVADAEIRAGLRPPPGPDDDAEDDARSTADDPADLLACASRPMPSADLKRMFRDVAKALHPDLAPNDPARYRRHSLMAEANRAYANRDEDRLRLILQAWERRTDLAIELGPDADRQSVSRRLADIDARLLVIEIEFADLRRSAIAQLQTRIENARTQGWDLINEMVGELKREIARAFARLARLRRDAAR